MPPVVIPVTPAPDTCDNCGHFEPGPDVPYVTGPAGIRSNGRCRRPRIGEGKNPSRPALSSNWCAEHRRPS